VLGLDVRRCAIVDRAERGAINNEVSKLSVRECILRAHRNNLGLTPRILTKASSSRRISSSISASLNFVMSGWDQVWPGWECEFYRPDPYLPYKVPTRVLMAMLESITQGLNVLFGVDATPVISVHDWKNNSGEHSLSTDRNMERTESGLGTNTVELFDKVGVPLVWTIVKGVTMM